MRYIDNPNRVCGIYKWINKINGHYYVGSSMDLFRPKGGRRVTHLHKLKVKQHGNKHFQNAWYFYGEVNFEFIVVERLTNNISRKQLQAIEQKYLDVAKLEQDKCYNKSFSANRQEITLETRKLMSESHKGKIPWNKGLKGCLSQEIRQRMSNSHKGKKLPSEQRLKISRSNTGKGVDSKIFLFRNRLTNKVFMGRCWDLYKKYELDSKTTIAMVRGTKKSYKNWQLVELISSDN